MRHLAGLGPWPDDPRAWQHGLRVSDVSEIGDSDPRKRVGLVYADGNAMGRLVQELDSSDVTRAFSTIVDSAVRAACFEALAEVTRFEIGYVRHDHEQGRPLRPLPADVLLLGGDDLLVLLPGERALLVALLVCRAFERLTAAAITGLTGDARRFFEKRGLLGHGMTISCGVAIGPAKHPFYLLLDLAEQLLKNAKNAGSAAKDRSEHRAPAHVDFHVIAGAASLDLGPLRREDYHADSDHPRTLRPFDLGGLDRLRLGAHGLRSGGLPRSKLHDLFDAALALKPALACRGARELFGRLRQDHGRNERRALWEALAGLGQLAEGTFPYFAGEAVPDKPNQRRHRTALADLVEACDLFPAEDRP
jgi:CRISPR-associated protein Cmr2